MTRAEMTAFACGRTIADDTFTGEVTSHRAMANLSRLLNDEERHALSSLGETTFVYWVDRGRFDPRRSWEENG